MEPAQRAAARARVVVLHELRRNAVGRPRVGAVGLEEETALVAVDPRGEQDESGQLGGQPFHGEQGTAVQSAVVGARRRI